MTIYRIASKTEWEEIPVREESDEFVEAESNENARNKFVPRGTLDTIVSIAETSFENIDDPKYYLVGVGARGDEDSSEYFLVKAKNASNAFNAVREKEMAYSINSFYSELKLRINRVAYLGELSKEKKEEVIRSKAIRKEVDGFDMPWSA